MAKAKWDNLIEEIVQSPYFDIHADGSVFTRIDRSGRVQDKWRGTGRRRSDGYCSLKYKYKHIQIHRIVFRKFVGALNSDLEINHKDGCPWNNRVENLELITAGENVEHSYRVLNHLRSPTNAKIDQSTAEEIRAGYRSGLSLRMLAEKFGLSKTSISYIVNNKTWVFR